MAKKTSRSSRARKAKPTIRTRVGSGLRRVIGWLLRGVVAVAVIVFVWVLAYRWIDPPTTPYIWSEGQRLGAVSRDWRDLDAIAPSLARSVVAAEDANFCDHWGFDVNAIRSAIEAGANRGASTISQQVVKNAFLWQGRSWVRKAAEAVITPVMETLWPKRRIVEVYLNVAEMGEGVFGAQAAARHWFGVDADDLTPAQAARIAAILPNPKARSAARPSAEMQRKARRVADGAATIRADGRAACFED
ncbi:monofunctional biosynthetic peptidoglycan transglycosylase [uncultured Jannaschia sp.]|uniref:monofunctional biosynthetic peptidoglycan transglycosylase n=1 Tax=uncultured Jannaschia sp. TaxID=293347 RepID=UPI0026233B91|nr:monofunctional biosynthetic peptidoglycan transglycosylase [uncultured Jannaschia sp.]